MIEFFDDVEIFITGGSGVVGKALIEKLLRSSNVRRCYLLLRPKKNQSVEERMQNLKKSKIFLRVLKEKPNCFDKVEAIVGDCLSPRLGISPQDMEKLQNVSIFYHSAATVRFDEPLKLALSLNLGGTYEALLLAETMKKLKVFMYVSTYFSNPYLSHVEEKVYDTPIPWKFALERVVKETDPNVLEILSQKIITGFPNTYCFTKNLSESMINDFRDRLPVTIFRPSIVIQALEEPFPGFPSTLFGAVGMFAMTGCGLLKQFYLTKGNRLDMTPLDICVKTMIYYTIRAKQVYDQVLVPEQAPVYLVTSDHHFKFDFADMTDLVTRENIWLKYAFEKNLFPPNSNCTESKLRYRLYVLFQQLPLAILGDLLMLLLRKEPIVLAMTRKCFVTLKVMEPFRCNNYTNNGVTHLEEMLEETRNTTLAMESSFDKLSSLDGLISCINDMVLGIRTYLLNEDLSTIPRARKTIEMKIFVYNFIRGILLYHVLAAGINFCST